MSVCLVTGEYPPAVGGVADYTALLAQHLAAQGARVTVLTSRPLDRAGASATSLLGSAPSPPSGERVGVRGQPLATDAAFVTSPSSVRYVDGWGLRSLGAIAAEIAEIGPDVVHLQYQAAAFGLTGAVNALPLALRRRGVRAAFVTTFHDLRVPYLFPKAGPLRRLAIHALIGGSSGAIFTDPAGLARAHSRRPAVWIPMAPTLWPERPPARETARAALGVEPHELALAHFGFVNATKGLHTLLRATERLVRAGLEPRLLMVGEEVGASDSTNIAVATRLAEHADALGIADLIIRTGHGDAAAVSAALAAADIAVLPYSDGASLRRSSLLACLAHGLPVVTTRPARQPELPPTSTVAPFESVESFRIDERVAVLVDPRDDAALARAIYRLADEPERMRLLGENGHALALRLSWPNVAAATVRFYRRLLDSRGHEQETDEEPE